MTFDIARQVKNSSSNRYRDVLPYDQTRVILQTDTNSDYINANHIDVKKKKDKNRFDFNELFFFSFVSFRFESMELK